MDESENVNIVEIPTNPCEAVRKSCKDYVSTQSCQNYVTIESIAIARLAGNLYSKSRGERTSGSSVEVSASSSAAAAVQWDEENWHYHCPSHWPTSFQQERVAAYILALDAINFCFWPSTQSDSKSSTESAYKYEYVDLATTLTRAAMSDHEELQTALAMDIDQEKTGQVNVFKHYAFNASNLKRMSPSQMRKLFQDHHATERTPPDIEKRCLLWNEVGTVLQANYRGSTMALIEEAGHSAPKLVHLLLKNFPGFRDVSHYSSPSGMNNGEDCYLPIHFYKRAQICVGDWNAALKLNLHDMDQLTTFADYRVPQLLRHWNVLNYSTDVVAKIDACCELTKDGKEEIAIRACTIVAVELLVHALANLKKDDETMESDLINDTCFVTSWNAVSTDWYLWQVGEQMQNAGELKPHHRVRTIFY